MNRIKEPLTRKVLVFKTDIKTKRKMKAVGSIFENLPVITRWTIDTDDIDNVLRIEASGQLKETEVIDLIKTRGFYCEELTD